jgi:hypothetical protein
MSAITGAEMAMRDVGIMVTPGSGAAAAGEYWRSTAAPLLAKAGASSPDSAAKPAETKPARAAVGA